MHILGNKIPAAKIQDSEAEWENHDSRKAPEADFGKKYLDFVKLKHARRLIITAWTNYFFSEKKNNKW